MHPAGPATGQANLEDEPIAPFQRELLDLAFRAASALPADPHVKDRCRAQEAVIAAALRLGQPLRAERYVAAVQNWRRGTGYADLAHYCAERGATGSAERFLVLAGRIASESEAEGSAQEWRRDRIRAKVARTYAFLGKTAQAREWAAGVVESEVHWLASAQARQLAEADFAAELQRQDRVFAAAPFEHVHAALETCVELYRRFHDDPDRRAQLELRVRTAYAKLPTQLRLEMLFRLVEIALERQDRVKALELVRFAQDLMSTTRWLPEDHVALRARLARLRYRAGDHAGARTEADAARTVYEARRQVMVDIHRAGALRPLAETYQALGDRAAALDVYRRAVAEGIQNPNSRPRAEDLAATCSSMAVAGVEPDAALLKQLVHLCDGLGHPW